MTTHVTYPTRFGQFASCDFTTYKRLKRINHLLQFARVQARRWLRAQRRQPHNRCFVRRQTVLLDGRLHTTVTRRVVTDAMVCGLFWTIRAPADSPQADGAGARELTATSLRATFPADYRRARYPAPAPEEAVPLTLQLPEIVRLQAELEAWHQAYWVRW